MTLNHMEFLEFGAFSANAYPDAFWEPLSVFLKATYDDSSSVQLEFNPVARLALLEFFQNVFERSPEVKKGENATHESQFDFVSFVKAKAPAVLAFITHDYSATQGGQALADGELTACWDYV